MHIPSIHSVSSLFSWFFVCVWFHIWLPIHPYMLILFKPFWLFLSPLPLFWLFPATASLFLLFFIRFSPVFTIFQRLLPCCLTFPPAWHLPHPLLLPSLPTLKKNRVNDFLKERYRCQKSLITIAKMLNWSFWLLFLGLGGYRRTCKSYWTFLLNFIVVEL